MKKIETVEVFEPKFDVVEWFAEKAGKTSYRDDIAILQKVIDEGGITNATAEILRKEIENIRQLAQDRYDDWVSDIDY